MKSLLVLFFTLLSISMNAQSRLGFSSSEVKAAFPEYVFKTAYTTSYTKYIYTDFGLGTFAYFFNSNDVVESCLFVPSTTGKLHTLIQKFNNEYVIISSTHWVCYVNGGVVNIRLKYQKENDEYCIFYTNS